MHPFQPVLSAVGVVHCGHGVSEFRFERNLGNGAAVRLRMPVIPMLGVGLWPLLQMTLLPPLVFVIAKWRVARNSSENGNGTVAGCRNQH